MPKKGERLPFKVTFQYASQETSSTTPFDRVGKAAKSLLEFRDRGATATMAYRDLQGKLHPVSDAHLMELLGDLQPPWDVPELIERLKARDWEKPAEDAEDAEVPCVVVTGLSLEEEERVFQEQQAKRDGGTS